MSQLPLQTLEKGFGESVDAPIVRQVAEKRSLSESDHRRVLAMLTYLNS
jgi:hypothetical protein